MKEFGLLKTASDQYIPITYDMLVKQPLYEGVPIMWNDSSNQADVRGESWRSIVQRRNSPHGAADIIGQEYAAVYDDISYSYVIAEEVETNWRYLESSQYDIRKQIGITHFLYGLSKQKNTIMSQYLIREHSQYSSFFSVAYQFGVFNRVDYLKCPVEVFLNGIRLSEGKNEREVVREVNGILQGNVPGFTDDDRTAQMQVETTNKGEMYAATVPLVLPQQYVRQLHHFFFGSSFHTEEVESIPAEFGFLFSVTSEDES